MTTFKVCVQNTKCLLIFPFNFVLRGIELIDSMKSNIFNTIIFKVSFAVFALVLSSCSSTSNPIAKSNQPSAGLSVTSGAAVPKIDGHLVNFWNFSSTPSYRLVPGTHHFHLYARQVSLEARAEADWTLRAGHQYLLSANAKGSSFQFRLINTTQGITEGSLTVPASRVEEVPFDPTSTLAPMIELQVRNQMQFR